MFNKKAKLGGNEAHVKLRAHLSPEIQRKTFKDAGSINKTERLGGRPCSPDQVRHKDFV